MKHEFVALSSWSIDTDITTVVVVCRACGLYGEKHAQFEGHQDGLLESVGARLVAQAEQATVEHVEAYKAAKVLANRPGATTTPQTVEEKE